MAEEASSGRSGYWKLFFYNMQEEALREKEPESKSVEKPKSAKVAKPKRRVAKQQPVVVSKPEVVRLPLRLSPVVEQPTAYSELAQTVPLPTATLYSISVYQNRAIIESTEQKRKHARRRAAVFLLLAA